jgi:hypothetical protein
MSEAAQVSTGLHDFDFFYGSWRVHNRRLKVRLGGSDDWETFEAITPRCAPVLGGLGNTDELHLENGDRIGMSLRFFNLQTQQWSIYWVSARDGILQPPVVGSFSDGVGIFEGPDVYDGKPILMRFTWSDITPSSARWQQAFSPDSGQTWETNWIMTFTRIEGAEVD